MSPNDPNVQMLDVVAQRLGDDLCGRLVFVGGAVAGLLITDPAQPAIRPTEDVDLLAQVIAAPAFVATKLEAFAGRGQGDFLFSHDMADIVSVIDGRESLLAEMQQAPPELRHHVKAVIAQLRRSRGFMDSLPGHLPGDAASRERLPDLHAKLQRLSKLD